jgi:D-alanyl-D-alanine carboxypeptidase (penicillin-binding protein 5/6)
LVWSSVSEAATKKGKATPIPFKVAAGKQSNKGTRVAPDSKTKTSRKKTTVDLTKTSTPARDPRCQAWVVGEFTSGEILSESNASKPLPPASMTKLMTAYVVMKSVASGNTAWDDKVAISARASNVGGSQVYLREGEQFSVRELMQALMIQSANDSAIALAEHIGGSKEGFVEMMNSSAKELGMNSSEFHSPHGLPPEPDQRPDLVSANDFLVLSRALLSKYPQLTEFTGQMEGDFRGGKFKMRNHNKLLQTFAGCDGLKTGYYNEAGFSVAATAQRNGVRVISVVMGCGDRKHRDNEASRLLAEGLKKYKKVLLAKAGEVIDANKPVTNGEKSGVSLKIQSDVSALVRLDGETSAPGIVKEIDGCQNIQAPLHAGTACGTVKFSRSGQVIAETPLFIGEDVEPASLSTKILRMFKLA